ncbi:hypothetical protein NFX46_20110 [Streptomyces phaeoluteigriseus]|uniref:Uncharacterized protein n=1 Tax=Streptomyces phaeoluteigriseus TaxID=114686 RepID=A0ABY4Z9X8_9ACTN|nr:hypothetical protein [Streptomyces phaeoluteigriseus]USQ85844.1 hypothetical protein NFX46_20110 [Streptomyces phaeoluteigriseus]
MPTRLRRTCPAGLRPHTKYCSGQLPDEHVRMVAALFDGDWTDEGVPPAALQ